jgi:hypothetical protein
MPVEMRMLTYYQESCEMNSTNGLKVTNFSSRDSNSNSFLKRRTSADNVSYNSVNNLKTDNVYKPFKQEKAKGTFFCPNKEIILKKLKQPQKLMKMIIIQITMKILKTKATKGQMTIAKSKKIKLKIIIRFL